MRTDFPCASIELQQCFGDGEDALTAELVAVAQFEILDFALEGSLCHGRLQARRHRSVKAVDCDSYGTF